MKLNHIFRSMVYMLRYIGLLTKTRVLSKSNSKLRKKELQKVSEY